MKDKKINVEISIKENKINISCDLNDLQEIARLIMVRDDLELNMDSRNISLSKNTNSTKITTDNDNPESISIFLLDQLSALTGWKLKTRDRYSTIRSFRNGILGKSALYFSLGRDNIFNLSIHNDILSSVLTKIYWVDGLNCHLKEYFIIDEVEFDEAYQAYIKDKYGKIDQSLIDFCLSCFYLDIDYGFGVYKPDFFLTNKRHKEKEILLLPFNDEELLSDVIFQLSAEFDSDVEIITGGRMASEFEISRENREYINKYLSIGEGVADSLIKKGKSGKAFFDYTEFLENVDPSIAMLFDAEKRFPGTKRLRFSSKFQLQEFLEIIKDDLQSFLHSN
jgi:hypothetical protein